jgi:hypothetical protein
MLHIRVILAVFIIAISAISAADSAQGTYLDSLGSHQSNAKTGPVTSGPFTPVRTAIEIGSIDYGSAAPGNSEPVTVSVNVISTAYPQGICGLDKSNFKIEVPTHGFGYTAIAIQNVLGISATAVGSPVSCGYGVKIAPGIYQGKQYKWTNSPGTFNLYYFVGGNQIAVATFDLKMYAN